ncbi:hypothetical protein I2F17_11520 [Acinetobacter sp. B10A]|uniref:hypothetical protein n=1 Tax=Acinetobacter baretiae TaxID=2605383 RepID=UPI001B3C705F|nr:hypothetical protein [Acinetobacter baretiae]MBF7686448.1 hypothetical protein [Acinetobacter baretiae]
MDITFFKPHFKSLNEIMPNKKLPYQPPRQRVWMAIRTNAAEFTVQQVADLGNMKYESTRSFVSQLVKAGLVKVTKITPVHHVNCTVKQKVYCLVDDVGYHYPQMSKSGKLLGVTGNKAMWNTLRITQKAMCADELAKQSSNEVLHVKSSTASSYLAMLYEAGYLKCVENAKTTGGKAKYMLLPHMNTGAKPPQIQRVKQVFDPNLNQTMYSERPELDEEAQHGVLGVFYA